MVSYPHRPKSGQITCYLNRTYHVLTTFSPLALFKIRLSMYPAPSIIRHEHLR